MTRWVVRHAAPAVAGICYGRFDFGVRVPHAEAAARVRAALHGARPSTVISSPLGRCHGLARALAAELEAPLRTDARLRELDFGAWEGRPWRHLHASSPRLFEAWASRWKTVAPPLGESLPELVARVDAAWAEVPADAIVVAHAGVIRALWHRREGLDHDAAMQRAVPHLTPMRVA